MLLSGSATSSPPDTSPMVSSTSGRSRKSILPTSGASRSATSSPASGSGLTPFGLPDGATIDLFGPVPVRANLSATQAKAVGLMTSGTSGRRGFTSSASAALCASTASRLQAAMPSDGGTLFTLTWKTRATPAGLSISALRASARRTSGSGSTGWPTPTSHNPGSAEDPAARRRRGFNAGLDVDGRRASRDSVSLLGDAGMHDRARRAGETDADRALESHRSGVACSAVGDAERDGLRIGRRPAADEPHKSGYWSVCDWIECRDGKRRPVEPGTFPLAHGSPARVGRLRAYGNAIVAPLAAEFVRATA
jgi:hypothetical protein